MRFQNGWIKLNRKLLNDDWSDYLDVIGKGILAELLLMANVQSSRYLEGGELKTLERGQVLIGLRQFAQRLRCDRSTVVRRLNLLKKLGTIDIKTSHHGTMITICKYSEYQGKENNSEPNVNQGTNHPTNHPTNHLRATEPTPIEEPKKLKKLRTKEVPSPPLGSDWLQLGEAWLKFALEEMPWQSKQKNWTPDAFGRELEKVGKAMDINAGGFTQILTKLTGDHFWRKNAASPFGLLKRSGSNGNRKIDNLLVSFRSKGDREKEALAKFADSNYKPGDVMPF